MCCGYGLYLGIRSGVSQEILNSQEGNMSYYPVNAVLDSVKWKQAVAYFIAKAPEHLLEPPRVEPIHKLPCFKILPTPAEWFATRTLTSYVKIDESVNPTGYSSRRAELSGDCFK